MYDNFLRSLSIYRRIDIHVIRQRLQLNAARRAPGKRIGGYKTSLYSPTRAGTKWKA